MKKKSIIALFLIMLMVFSICACGGSEPTPEKAIIGDWVRNDETLTLEPEGKGSVANDSTEQSVVWLYNEEVKMYEITTAGETFFGEIIDKDGAEILLLDESLEFVRVTE